VDIKKGEEICVSYFGYDDLHSTMTADNARLFLQHQRGIVCDENCLCFNEEHLQKIKLGRELAKALVSLGSAVIQRHNGAEAHAAAERCVELQRLLPFSIIVVKRTPTDGFQIIIKEVQAQELISNYLDEARKSVEQDVLYEGSAGGSVNIVKPFSVYKIRVIH